jgi:hypothetical protein
MIAVETDQADAMLCQNKSLVLLDVRTLHEYLQVRLAGATCKSDRPAAGAGERSADHQAEAGLLRSGSKVCRCLKDPDRRLPQVA